MTHFVRHVNTISNGVPSIRCEHTGRAKLAPQKPHIQYFKAGETLNSEYLRYTRDKNSFPTVAVAAIHGLVEQYVSVSHDSAGMLTSFDIQTEELERIEGVVNEEERQRGGRGTKA